MTDYTLGTPEQLDRADHELDVRKDDAMDRAYMAREIARLRAALKAVSKINAWMLRVHGFVQLEALDDGPRWRPSIHMPRWASRITLEVTDVRLERLQDISEEDAKAEGVATRCLAEPDESPECSVGFRNPDGFALDNFRSLWDAINGAESWDANPWVWVVSFRRLQP